MNRLSHPAILDGGGSSAHVAKVSPHIPPGTPIYGVVTFTNERGILARVECGTRADYERELNAGAKWAALQPKRPLSVEGQVLVPTDPMMFGRDLKGVQ